MHIHIAAVGRAKRGPEQALFEHYADRLRWPLTLTQVQDRKKRAGEELKAAEAALLLDAVPSGAVIVALDERGRELSSPDLAQRLERWRDQGRADIAFVIGGADGLHPSVRERADLVIALGRMTWPHMLVRALLAEQIYRAQSILDGHPYHRA